MLNIRGFSIGNLWKKTPLFRLDRTSLQRYQCHPYSFQLSDLPFLHYIVPPNLQSLGFLSWEDFLPAPSYITTFLPQQLAYTQKKSHTGIALSADALTENAGSTGAAFVPNKQRTARESFVPPNCLHDQKSFFQRSDREFLIFSKLANSEGVFLSVTFNASVYESTAFCAEGSVKNASRL